ncbi:MAG TPA: DUF11 domain-containing protein [Thermoleophilaceae bacterium]
MTRARAAAAAVVAGAAAAVLMAAPAQAATFGSADLEQPLSPAAGCASYPCSIVDDVHADGSDERGAPIDGVLTRVRMRYAGDGAVVAFRVLRPSGPGSFLNAGPELAATLSPSSGAAQTLTFAARRPVQEGDRLALAAGDSLSGDAYLASGDPRRCLVREGLHPVGSSQPYDSGSCDAEVVLQGTVEPDTDADGYGDESQDGCPADPAIHDGPCSADLELTATATPAQLLLADTAVYTMTVRNLGTSPSENIGLRVPVGETAQLVGTRAGSGLCGGVRAVFCWLGTLRAGESTTVAVAVRPGSPGTVTVRGSVISATSDPDAGNNSASASTRAIDPFAGVVLPLPRASVRRGVARVLHACPSNTPRYCQGAASVKQAAPVVPGGAGASSVPVSKGPRLGRGSFRLQPGAISTVSVRLSKRAARKLSRRRRLTVVVTSVAQDGAGTRRTTYARVVLVDKSPRRRRR